MLMPWRLDHLEDNDLLQHSWLLWKFAIVRGPGRLVEHLLQESGTAFAEIF